MYVTRVPNRNSPPAVLIRESYREGGKVKNRTVANISKLPPETIEMIRRSLNGDQLVSPEEAFDIVASYDHGNVKAVLLAMQRLGFADIIASRRSKMRDLAVSLVAARILFPDSKLATTRSWGITSLPRSLGVEDATEDDLYAAMDWLLERQEQIEKKLSSRHLRQGGLALYDLSSSYFEGVTCPLAKFGHNRDGKAGKLQVNYGLLTDSKGRPVSVSVFDGNTGDPKTLLPQVERVRDKFDIDQFVIVGDRGMITQKQIETLRETEGMDWVTALRSEGIRKLVEGEEIQMGLFDERGLFELVHADYPGERLIACRNPPLAERRTKKRLALIESTCKELEKIAKLVNGRSLTGRAAIQEAVDAARKSSKIGSYCHVDVQETGFEFCFDEAGICAAAEQYGKGDAGRTAKRVAFLTRQKGILEKKLKLIQRKSHSGRLCGKENIGVRVGKVVNKYWVAKHFKLKIGENSFHYEVDQVNVAAEAALDGIYVVRTSVSRSRMAPDEAVRTYKMLANVERAFRAFKSVDFLIRPIFDRKEQRVRSHIFLCMLAYYVLWHMIEAWRPLLFADEDQDSKALRDPVAPAQRSESALKKMHLKTLEDGNTVHSFYTLAADLSSIVLNVCTAKGGAAGAHTFEVTTIPTKHQQRVLSLIENIRM